MKLNDDKVMKFESDFYMQMNESRKIKIAELSDMQICQVENIGWFYNFLTWGQVIQLTSWIKLKSLVQL